MDQCLDTNGNNEILTGSINKMSIKLMIPVLIGQIFIIIYGLTDSFFISLIDRKSTSLVSALGLVFPIYFFFTAISIGLSGGVSSLVARAIGEKNNKSIEKIGDSGLALAGIIALISIILLYIFGEVLITNLSGKSLSVDVTKNALSYLYFIIPGIGFLLLMQTLGGILQGEGLMQYSAIAMFLSVIINIALDPLFIFVFKLGIAGASLATSISIFIAFLFLLLVFLNNKSVIKIKFKLESISINEIKEIARVGLSQGLNLMLLSISFMIINYCVGSIGESTLNAWTLVGRMDEFILMVGYALASSTLTITGQNYGNKNILRVKQTFRINIFYGIVGSLLLAIIYNIFAYPLFGLLTGNQIVLDNCIKQVRLLSFSYIGIVV